MLKRCSKCKIEKPLDEFSKDPRSKDGHGYYCKSCAVANATAWAKAHPEQKRKYALQCYYRTRDIPEKHTLILVQRRKRRKANPQPDRDWAKQHRQHLKVTYTPERAPAEKFCYSCKVTKPKAEFNVDRGGCDGLTARCRLCQKAKNRKYYFDNHEEQLRRIKENHIRNADKECAYRKRMWAEGKSSTQKNPEMRRVAARRYYRNHKKEVLEYSYNRIRTNGKLRLAQRIRTAIWRTIKGQKKRHWEELVGYTFEELKQHLEKQFQPGMSWDNYGKWHVDHVVPVVVFNFDKPEHIDFKRCWELENLQPMWSVENIAKGAKLRKHFQPALKLEIA